MGRKSGAPLKLLLIGVIVGLVIGVVLSVFYFSLATFFTVQTKALDAQQEAEEERNKNKDVTVTEKIKIAGARDKAPVATPEGDPSPAKDKSSEK
jgi:flagellar basal body-associated protein FliL